MRHCGDWVLLLGVRLTGSRCETLVRAASRLRCASYFWIMVCTPSTTPTLNSVNASTANAA